MTLKKFIDICFCVDSIFNGKIAISNTDERETGVLDKPLKFNSKARSKSKTDEERKSNNLKSINALYYGRELTLNKFKI